jgi:hypothetical protein
MAGAMITPFPLLAVFAVAQNHSVEGTVMSGIKGKR